MNLRIFKDEGAKGFYIHRERDRGQNIIYILVSVYMDISIQIRHIAGSQKYNSISIAWERKVEAPLCSDDCALKASGTGSALKPSEHVPEKENVGEAFKYEHSLGGWKGKEQLSGGCNKLKQN